MKTDHDKPLKASPLRLSDLTPPANRNLLFALRAGVELQQLNRELASNTKDASPASVSNTTREPIVLGEIVTKRYSPDDSQLGGGDTKWIIRSKRIAFNPGIGICTADIESEYLEEGGFGDDYFGRITVQSFKPLSPLEAFRLARAGLCCRMLKEALGALTDPCKPRID